MRVVIGWGMTFTNPTDHIPFRDRLGRCYELAGQVTLHNPGATLVHGSIQNFGRPRLHHAWVRLEDGSLWEPATNRIWTPDGFAGLFNGRQHVAYPHRLAVSLAVTTEHWGPYRRKEIARARVALLIGIP